MALFWKDYISIRKLDERVYFESHNIRNYAQLISRINKSDVVPPQESEVAHLFVKEEIKELVAKPETPKRKPAKKPAPKVSQKTDISKRASTRSKTRKKPANKK